MVRHTSHTFAIRRYESFVVSILDERLELCDGDGPLRDVVTRKRHLVLWHLVTIRFIVLFTTSHGEWPRRDLDEPEAFVVAQKPHVCSKARIADTAKRASRVASSTRVGRMSHRANEPCGEVLLQIGWQRDASSRQNLDAIGSNELQAGALVGCALNQIGQDADATLGRRVGGKQVAEKKRERVAPLRTCTTLTEHFTDPLGIDVRDALRGEELLDRQMKERRLVELAGQQQSGLADQLVAILERATHVLLGPAAPLLIGAERAVDLRVSDDRLRREARRLVDRLAGVHRVRDHR